MKKVLAALLFVVLMSTPAFAIPVGTELVLLADVSGSLDTTDFNLQRNGYAAAFRDVNVINAIMSETGGIAVTLVYWSVGQVQSVGWTQITNAAESNAFADLIMAASRPTGIGVGTGLADSMNYAVNLFDNGYESTKQIVDVSGDGADSVDDGSYTMDAIHVQAARDALVAGGVDMINALWIDDRNYFGDDAEDSINAVEYGKKNVIYGSGSFSWIVQDYEGFEQGIKNKIYTEIHGDPEGVPEPMTMVLLGLGLVGLAGVRRKIQK